MKKQRVAEGCTGPAQYKATLGEMEEKKQGVISSIRIANVYYSSESPKMHTAEREP